MKTIHVTFSKRSPKKAKSGYPIHISGQERDWLRPLKSLGIGRCLILTSPRVARYCLPELRRNLAKLKIRNQALMISDGERFKNLVTVGKAYSALVQAGIERSTPVLLLGGGVIGDLGGFVAATILRGVPFVQIGTTLVAQVDSSIGGKLGIDLPEGKNLAGVFGQPRAVFSHVPYLKTLPEREVIGGLAEVLKYGIIGDPSLFQLLRKEREKILKRDTKLLFEIVRCSSAMKASVVGQDEKESSLRMTLNFGHTFGHAIERLTHYRKYLHGEAVGIGMTIAARLSHEMGFCSKKDAEEIETGVRALGLPTKPPSFAPSEWTRALEVDKKSRDGMIHFVFAKGIGQVTIVPTRPATLVKEFLK